MVTKSAFLPNYGTLVVDDGDGRGELLRHGGCPVVSQAFFNARVRRLSSSQTMRQQRRGSRPAHKTVTEVETGGSTCAQDQTHPTNLASRCHICVRVYKRTFATMNLTLAKRIRHSC
jgi:hypothetical protein